MPDRQKKARFSMKISLFKRFLRKLSTQAELSYDSTVAVDVTILKIVKE